MTDEEIAALKAENEKNKKELEDLKAKAPKVEPPNPNQDDKEKDLFEKFKKQQILDNQKTSNNKSIENAVKFNYELDSFINDNKDILPSDIANIAAQSKKENYDSVNEKANAIKSGFVQSFFAVQANLDLLTATQKNAVEDFLKLSKIAKEDKASEIYENIFEPTIQTIKKVKKAEEVAKAKFGGYGTATSSEKEHIEKLKAASKKAHLKK